MALCLSGAVLPAAGQDWGGLTTISTTMGVHGSRICMGEASRGDIGCPAYAPSITTSGHVSVTGNLSAGKFLGDGSQLTNLPSATADRITSGTTSVAARSSGVVSITTNGVTANYFNASGLLVTPGISVTTVHGISSTNAYFSRAVGINTASPTQALDVNAAVRFGDNAFGSVRITSSNSGGTHNYIQSDDASGTQGSWQSLVFGAYLNTASASIPKMIIDANGSVGIGTSTPVYSLDVTPANKYIHINDNDSAGDLLIGDGTATANLYQPTFWGKPIGSGRALLLLSDISSTEDTGAVAAMRLISRADGSAALSTRPSFSFFNGATPQVTILANGNTGIGTVDPLNKLDVNGNLTVRGNVSLNTGGVIYGDPTNATNIFSLQSGSSANTGGYISLYPLNQPSSPGRISYVSVNDDAATSYAHLFYTRSTAGTMSLLLDIRKNGAATFAYTLETGASASIGGNLSTVGSITVGTQIIAPAMSSNRADNAVCWLSSSGRFYQTSNAAGCTNTSDIRLKRDIETLTPSLEKLLALRPVTFHWKDAKKGTELQLGFIAQETHKVIPEITIKPDAENTYWGMRYNALIPYLVKGVQELKGLLDGHSRELTKLRSENQNLRRDVEALKSAIQGKSRM